MTLLGMALQSTSAATSAPNWSSAIICRVAPNDACRAALVISSIVLSPRNPTLPSRDLSQSMFNVTAFRFLTLALGVQFFLLLVRTT